MEVLVGVDRGCLMTGWKGFLAKTQPWAQSARHLVIWPGHGRTRAMRRNALGVRSDRVWWAMMTSTWSLKPMNAYAPTLSPSRWRDPQYGAAGYLFTIAASARHYISDQGIRKADLLRDARAWSSGEWVLVRVGLDLFDPGCVEELGAPPAHLGEIVAKLDGNWLRAVWTAVLIARGAVSALDAVQSLAE